MKAALKYLPLICLAFTAFCFAKAEKQWVSLFDGESLGSWRGYCQESVPKKWVAENGMLRFKDDGTHTMNGEGGGDLITRHKYENFEFTLEWRISEGGNSGVLYLAQELCGADGEKDLPIYRSAPEMQLLDNERHPDAKLGTNDNRKAGSLYDLIPASPQNTKPAGQWNKMTLKIDNNHVTHSMNGEAVVKYTLGSKEWKAMCADSKFKTWTEFINTAKKGHIGLQDHGDDVWFKNIKIREL